MDIKKRIKECGFTLDMVAAKLKNNRGGIGISQPSMSSIVNGNPTIDRLQEIADIIGISLSELVADENQTPTHSVFIDGKEYVPKDTK